MYMTRHYPVVSLTGYNAHLSMTQNAAFSWRHLLPTAFRHALYESKNLDNVVSIQGSPKSKPLPNDQKIAVNRIEAC